MTHNATQQNEIQALYATLQDAEKSAKTSTDAKRAAGLALGKALFDLRASSKVVSGGTTFDSTLKTLAIPRRTAYRWIGKYEVTAGIRVQQQARDVLAGSLEDRRILGIDPHRDNRKSAVRLLRSIDQVNRAVMCLAAPYKVKLAAEGCKDREELEDAIRKLEYAKRSVDRSIPVLRAMLEATRTGEQKAAAWKLMSAEVTPNLESKPVGGIQ